MLALQSWHSSHEMVAKKGRKKPLTVCLWLFERRSGGLWQDIIFLWFCLSGAGKAQVWVLANNLTPSWHLRWPFESQYKLTPSWLLTARTSFFNIQYLQISPKVEIWLVCDSKRHHSHISVCFSYHKLKRARKYLKFKDNGKEGSEQRTIRVQVKARSAAVSALELGHQCCFPKTGIWPRSFLSQLFGTDCDWSQVFSSGNWWANCSTSRLHFCPAPSSPVVKFLAATVQLGRWSSDCLTTFWTKPVSLISQQSIYNDFD